jgi:hypothetical protein
MATHHLYLLPSLNILCLFTTFPHRRPCQHDHVLVAAGSVHAWILANGTIDNASDNCTTTLGSMKMWTEFVNNCMPETRSDVGSPSRTFEKRRVHHNHNPHAFKKSGSAMPFSSMMGSQRPGRASPARIRNSSAE